MQTNPLISFVTSNGISVQTIWYLSARNSTYISTFFCCSHTYITKNIWSRCRTLYKIPALIFQRSVTLCKSIRGWPCHQIRRNLVRWYVFCCNFQIRFPDSTSGFAFASKDVYHPKTTVILPETADVSSSFRHAWPLQHISRQTIP